MVTILKWIAIALLGVLALLNAALTAALLWHMYRYDVPGAWIPEESFVWQYWTGPATVLGPLVLLRYTNPTERKASVVVLAVAAFSFALFLLLHLTGRLTVK